MSIIDRAATCIAAEIMELTSDQRRSFVFPDDCNGDTIDRARSAARAVISAIHFPDDNMIIAGADFDWFEGRSYPENDAAETWQAMIDAALKEPALV